MLRRIHEMDIDVYPYNILQTCLNGVAVYTAFYFKKIYLNVPNSIKQTSLIKELVMMLTSVEWNEMSFIIKNQNNIYSELLFCVLSFILV